MLFTYYENFIINCLNKGPNTSDKSIEKIAIIGWHNPENTGKAIKALQEIGSTEALKQISFLAHHYEQHTDAVLQALKKVYNNTEINLDEKVDKIIALNYKHQDYLKATIEMLGKIDTDKAIHMVGFIAEHGRSYADLAIKTLKAIGSDLAVEEIDYIASLNESYAERAINALVDINSDAAIKAIGKIGSKYPNLKQEVFQALKEFEEQSPETVQNETLSLAETWLKHAVNPNTLANIPEREREAETKFFAAIDDTLPKEALGQPLSEAYKQACVASPYRPDINIAKIMKDTFPKIIQN